MKGEAHGSTEDSILYTPGFQTPRRAILSLRFFMSCLLSGVINFIINFSIIKMTLQDDTYVGFWHKAPEAHSDVFPVVYDLLLTCALLCFLSTCATSWVVRKQVKTQLLLPIPTQELQRGMWRYLPVHPSSALVRGLRVVLLMMVCFYGPSIVVLAVLSLAVESDCGGSFEAACTRAYTYMWVKPAWSMLQVMLAYPVMYVAALASSSSEEPDDPSGTFYETL